MGAHLFTLAAIKGVELAIFIFLFAVVTGLGFFAARWRRAESLDHLDEWGLGGRNFGSWISWFLIGGGLYTAYTFVAGARPGFALCAPRFFARPSTNLIFPLGFLVAPPLWSASPNTRYRTPPPLAR